MPLPGGRKAHVAELLMSIPDIIRAVNYATVRIGLHRTHPLATSLCATRNLASQVTNGCSDAMPRELRAAAPFSEPYP